MAQGHPQAEASLASTEQDPAKRSAQCESLIEWLQHAKVALNDVTKPRSESGVPPGGVTG